jgi:hypothetical protein
MAVPLHLVSPGKLSNSSNPKQGLEANWFVKKLNNTASGITGSSGHAYPSFNPEQMEMDCASRKVCRQHR